MLRAVEKKDKRKRHRATVAPMPCLPYNAAVARPVKRKEIEATPKARVAEQEEWDRLRKKGVWDETSHGATRDWKEVQNDYRKRGKKVHLADMFGICVEKGSELLEGDPGRKFKYRVVFQGDQVVDEWWQAAQFEDLGSSPATLECARGRYVRMFAGP